MRCEVEYLLPHEAPPTAVGTVIVHGGLVDQCNVKLITENGSKVIWPIATSLGTGIEIAIEWAITWAQLEGVTKIYVEGAPDPFQPCSDLTE
jgi:hypothetical protein